MTRVAIVTILAALLILVFTPGAGTPEPHPPEGDQHLPPLCLLGPIEGHTPCPAAPHASP